MSSQTILIVVLAALCMGALAYAVLYDRITTETARERRIGTIRTAQPRVRGPAKKAGPTDRRSKVQAAIEDIERQQKSAGKMTLKRRLQQAGLAWSVPMFLIISASCALVMAAVTLASGANPALALVVGVLAGLFLPRFYVTRRGKKRLDAYLHELPNAVDVIVRGVKAGLPLNDCIRIVASEAEEPVRTEFARVVEAQAAGITISEALDMMYRRMPLPETNFLAIVISIQAKAGGSMSEALGNLSSVLRDRKKMKGKIQAMSMEAKASAAVIGSLPIVVMGLVHLVAPDYMVVLFTEPTGNLLLAGAATWMLIGTLVMKKMINFDF